MRIVFMGTPDIAAASLEAVIAAGHEVAAVFTRADKPVGRKQIMTPPPVKQVALQHEITVYQPKTLRDGEAECILREINPELIVVVAYGRILPKEILVLPKYGCINLHVSLLPKYRGSAPIQWAVLNGDTETGVTIMQMDEGVDTGDIISCTPVAISPEETSEELFEQVTATGAEALVKTIADIGSGKASRTPQDHSKATKAPPLTKEMAQFDFTGDAQKLHNLVRGMYSWPVAFFICDGAKIKVNSCRISELSGTPGTVLSTKPLTIACGSGALALLEVVPEGKKAMAGQAWAAGKRFKTGDIIHP